jgi:hypothetical protein
MTLIGGWLYRRLVVGLIRRWWLVLAVLAVVGLGVGWSQHNSAFVQEYIIHSNPSETADDLDSNDYHLLLIRQGLEGIADKPLGHGPGTAGIVSIRSGQGQLTENYYVQIGYEVGIVGALAFMGATVWLGIRLHRRHDATGLVLVVTLVGYVVTNMLLHTWSNETVAAQWWLWAGVALALPLASSKQNG